MNRLLHLRLLAALLLALVCALMPSCRGPAGGIDPNALQGTLPKVLDRHDAYVEADPELDPLSKEVFLASTKQLRSVLAAALTASNEATAPVLPIVPASEAPPTGSIPRVQ